MWVNPGLSISTIIIDVSARHYGYNLINAAGLPNGTLHPMLVRLQVSAWSPRNGNLPAGRQRRPARAVHQLTDDRIRVARCELSPVGGSA